KKTPNHSPASYRRVRDVPSVIVLEFRARRLLSRNSNIMRPPSFDPQTLRTYLRRHRIADLPALKEALGTHADLTVVRKLQPLGYLTSYTHRGRFYTLREIARVDDGGPWSHVAV